jgi:hypothetical protein
VANRVDAHMRLAPRGSLRAEAKTLSFRGTLIRGDRTTHVLLRCLEKNSFLTFPWNRDDGSVPRPELEFITLAGEF